MNKICSLDTGTWIGQSLIWYAIHMHVIGCVTYYTTAFVFIVVFSFISDYCWVQGQLGECSVTCGAGFKTRALLCVSCSGGTLGSAVAMTFCNGLPQPPTSEPCNQPACLGVWETSPWRKVRFLKHVRTKMMSHTWATHWSEGVTMQWRHSLSYLSLHIF